MNKDEIKDIIPHRDSMLLLDELRINDEGKAIGLKNIVGDEWFLDGHFPGNPVVPGVILCEILAQSACVLLPKDKINDGTPYFTGLDKVRFKSPVRPGDTFITECEITKQKHPFYFASAKGFVNEQLCISAEFSFAIIKNNK